MFETGFEVREREGVLFNQLHSTCTYQPGSPWPAVRGSCTMGGWAFRDISSTSNINGGYFSGSMRVYHLQVLQEIFSMLWKYWPYLYNSILQKLKRLLCFLKHRNLLMTGVFLECQLSQSIFKSWFSIFLTKNLLLELLSFL